MDIILIERVEKLGVEGDVVTVAGGYGRNFLLPQKKAIIASKANLKKVDEIKKLKAANELKELQAAQELATKLAGVSCTIPVQVGEEEKLFGAVTSNDICKVLEKEGIEIDKRKIVLDEPIRELGVFSIDVKLHQEVTGTVKVWVVKE